MRHAGVNPYTLTLYRKAFDKDVAYKPQPCAVVRLV